MVVLLRSLNVPARLAQGYAGGTLDPKLNAYVVRESVGHSWPEVYFPGYGWQRFEPTPASYASVPARPALPQNDTTSPNSGLDTPPISQSDAEARLQRLLEEQELRSGDASLSIEALRRAQAELQAQERLRQLTIGGGVLAALLAAVGLFLLSLRREVQGLSPANAAYTRLARMAGGRLTLYHPAHTLRIWQ